MVITRIVELSKGVEAFVQITRKRGWIVVTQAGAVQTQLVVVVERETCDLLGPSSVVDVFDG